MDLWFSEHENKIIKDNDNKKTKAKGLRNIVYKLLFQYNKFL
jgi:hypothetical protein